MLGNGISRAAAAAASAFGAAALLLAPGAAWSDASQAVSGAESHPDGVQAAVRVRYNDLDLAREEGVRALYARLDTAARRACGHYDVRNMKERQAWRSCRTTALTEAVRSIGLQPLEELAGTPRGRGIGPRITAETRASTR